MNSDFSDNNTKDQSLPSLDVEALDRLSDALDAYARDRRTSAAEKSEERDTILRACCTALTAGPLDLGVEFSPSSEWEDALAVLKREPIDDFPEARFCRSWMSFLSGQTDAEMDFEIPSSKEEKLWEPFRLMAFRALAYFGRRKMISQLLPLDGPLSFSEADAMVEAGLTEDINDDWLNRVAPDSNGILPDDVHEKWRMLLEAETVLARRPFPAEMESNLAGLIALAENPSREYIQRQVNYIAAKAAAALLRLRVADGRETDVLETTAAQLIPLWEREYLSAMIHWRQSNFNGAMDDLRSAVQHNPHQTCVLLALAILLSDASPEEALSALDHPEPSREMHITRAALLARLTRFEEALKELAACTPEKEPRNEPLRFCWAAGAQRYRRNEQFLRTALAEFQGDWARGEKEWTAALRPENLKAMQEARRFFVASQEMKSLGSGKGWRRSVLQQRMERGLHELGNVPLVGDAMFFRAAALIDSEPERALKDFEALLYQRSWMEAQRKTGGGRIAFIGDSLLRLGKPREAIRAYEQVNLSAQPHAKERLAVACVYAEVSEEKNAEAIRDSIRKAMALAPNSPWPHLIGAAGLLMTHSWDAAGSCLEQARERGGEDALCSALQTICSALKDKTSITDDGLSGMQLPDRTAAVIRLLCGPEDETKRIMTFVRSLRDQWLTHAPVNPQALASRLLWSLCDEGKWDEALEHAESLMKKKQEWATGLALLVRLRHALQSAVRGELEQADTELQKLQNRN